MPDCIINLVQRQVRPIGSSKARAPVEFGAKLSINVRNGFAFLHHIGCDPYYESDDLILQDKNNKKENGCCPE